jgi:hypothetical protein
MLLGNAQSLLDSIWAIFRGCWITTGKCPNNTYQPKGEKAELSSGYWQKLGDFYAFSLKRKFPVYLY